MVDTAAENSFERSKNQKPPTILAIGSGKGGVGKTVIAASMGLGLAMLKRRVVVVDADLGGANLHTVMGIDKPSITYNNFLNKEYKKLDEILIKYPDFENLKVLCGASGSYGIANLEYYQKMKFIRNLRHVDADFIILDLGAGTSYNVLDLFIAADHGIVLTNPDPLSVLESYNFVKQIFYRKIIKELRNSNGALDFVKKHARTEIFKSSMTIEGLLEEVTRMDRDAGSKMEMFINEFHPMLLLNMVNGSNDETNGLAVKVAAKELLSVDMEYLGVIHKDETVGKSLDAAVPFINYDSKSPASRDLANIIILRLLGHRKLRAYQEKYSLRQRLRKKGTIEKDAIICSVNCIYWDECAYRNGGYPCKLQHLVQVRGFHGET